MIVLASVMLAIPILIFLEALCWCNCYNNADPEDIQEDLERLPRILIN